MLINKYFNLFILATDSLSIAFAAAVAETVLVLDGALINSLLNDSVVRPNIQPL